MKNLAKFLGLNSGSAPEITVVEQAVDDTEIQLLNVDAVAPNPFQPRKTFDDDSLHDLADSIREHGIIQPLLVRRNGDGYELIAGERRLRAAKLAGLAAVPAIVRELGDKEMAELAMIENLQREDLHFLEEAEGFQQLLANFGLTQEELARRVGKNQSTIANKLRLLRLTAEVRQDLVAASLTERHARALLKLEDPDKQRAALAVICQNAMNVREAEDLVEGILDDISREMAKKAPRQNVVKIIRDVRIFLNTINTVVAEMKKSGLKVKVNQTMDEEFININLKIPKRRK
ncbi:nucleoid occlusion protein [Anaeroselena agilis]|uniref:Nucleoid occlusion protein n=1 Tax=Anaeroselena agilis TaxID=3063788 RepID=A0ABU3P2U4_9FIRM|nr:nucleoid occlusion protein [Selenomonadales bacterium 4137-cl]